MLVLCGWYDFPFASHSVSLALLRLDVASLVWAMNVVKMSFFEVAIVSDTFSASVYRRF
jgi:hypothetical protein